VAISLASTVLAWLDTRLVAVTGLSSTTGRLRTGGHRFTLAREPLPQMDGDAFADVEALQPGMRNKAAGEAYWEATTVVRVAYYRGGGDAAGGDRQSVMRDGLGDSMRIADACELVTAYDTANTGVSRVTYMGSHRAATFKHGEIWETRLLVRWRSDTIPAEQGVTVAQIAGAGAITWGGSGVLTPVGVLAGAGSITWGGSGTLRSIPPGAPLLWYDAQDINLLSNAGIADGDPIGTWKNKGVLGAIGDEIQATAGARPLFRRVATPGKINNLSAVEGDTARFMTTAAIGPFSQPLVIGIVFRPTDLATYVWYSGSAAAQCEMYFTAAANLVMAAGADSNVGLNVAAVTWQSWNGTYNGASSFGRLDGAQGVTRTFGSGGLSGFTLFAEGASGGFKAKGMIAEAIVCNDGTTGAQLETYFAAKYGVTPQ
jgi:hypothetical protein